jgi:ergothioneine biosynthesis protein EgtB
VNRAANIRTAMEEARAYTLQLLADVDETDFRCQAHTDFSPLGWHLGHIGVTEAFWILQQCQNEPPLSVTYERFFTPTDNPKPNRIYLPARAEILAYLDAVRERVFAFLNVADLAAKHPLLENGNIFNMLLQHEEQHTETMLLIKRLLAAGRRQGFSPCPAKAGEGWSESFAAAGAWSGMTFVPAGPFLMGSNDMATTLDNERPQHEVFVKSFVIDRAPVTNAEFVRFIDAGGYHNSGLWSGAGWRWREEHAVEHPLYWRWDAGQWLEIGVQGIAALRMKSPVMCVSWYEADAYARFVGKRLPTEVEWEKAASLGVVEGSGEVWEWTASWFAPYPGFVAYPYEGYSTPYFDGQHRVLRGGSWATRRHVRRTTFRNWYHPWVREIFAGFRCAQDA